MYPPNVFFQHRSTKILDYALSLTPNDRSAIKPYYIKTFFDHDEQKIKEFCSTESIRIRKISYCLFLLDFYKNDQLEKISSFMNFNGAITRNITKTFIDALPWLGIEVQNMESNNFNKSIQQDPNSVVTNWKIFSEACESFMDYLNFFDLAKLERVSSHFYKPINNHLKRKYSLKKMALFINFNLKEFLMEIDNGVIAQTREMITIYEFRFIMRHFGHHMQNITVQTDYLKATLNRSVINPATLDYENIVDVVCLNLMNFIDEQKCTNISVDYIKIRDSHVTQEMNFQNKALLKDLNYYKYDKMLHKFDINQCMTKEWLQMLSQKKYLEDLTILTDYPLIERRLVIEFLENIKLERISISSQKDLRIYHCDDLIEALVRNSRETLLEIHIKECHSEELPSLINRFSNLNVLDIENICGRGGNLLYKLSLPNLLKLRISSCNSVSDEFCYNFIRMHKMLKYLDISNCDCVDGTFLCELNDQLSKNLFEVHDELEINITNTQAGYLYNREEIQITNDKLLIINENKNMYSDEEITRIIDDRCDLADLSANECFNLASNHEIPLSFKEILEQYKKNLHMNLSNYCHLSEKILKFISTMRSIKKLSICTHYPKVNYAKVTEVFSRFEIPEIEITGFDLNVLDKRNISDSAIIRIANINMTHLAKLTIAHCFIGPMTLLHFNKFINLNSLILINVGGLLQQDFDKLNFPQVNKIEFQICSELNDKMCFKIIKKCPNLKQLYISKCNSIEGFFLRDIDTYLFERQLPITVTITESPAVINYWRGDIEIKYIKLVCNPPFNNCLEDDLEKLKIVLDKKIKKDIKDNFVSKIYGMILTKSSLRNTNHQELFNIYSKLHYLNNLNFLIISYFNPDVQKLINFSKLNLRTLEIQNEELYAKDLTSNILEKCAQFNADHLHTLKLVECKIDMHCIISLNKLKNLSSLTFKKVKGLSNGMAKHISLKNLKYLAIIDNNTISDQTCFHIIKTLSLTNFTVSNCNSLTDKLLEKLLLFDLKLKNCCTVNISGTPAGYHYLINSEKYNFKYFIIRYDTHETQFTYIKNMLLDSKTVKCVPLELISIFLPTDLLDLTEIFPDLNDLSFELISQLDKLRRIKIFPHYRNVLNRKQMIINISKLNLERLIIDGNDCAHDCEDIIEAFANGKPNELLEISIRNCMITTNLLESLNKFRNLHEVRIFKESTNYLNKIIEEFEFSKSPLYHMYVNDELIENNTETIEKIKKNSLGL